MESTYPGCRSLFREALNNKNISEDAQTILLAALTDNSYKQYDSEIKKWWMFCSEKNISFFNATQPQVLEFFAQLFKKGASYETIVSTRSALTRLMGEEFIKEVEIKRFMRGVYNLRPSKPKYHETWDPSIVLEYLSKLPEDINLKISSQKLITLLALVTGHRMQTFSLIKLENIKDYNSKIEIRIPDRIKTSAPGRKQPLLVLPEFTDRKSICVASTLRDYLAKTLPLRGNENCLFISHRRPHAAVTAQTLSKWIKNVMEKAGVDTSSFTAYSTRHASTSAARRKGLDVDTIRRTATWTANSSVFARFYNLPLTAAPSAFAEAVLSENNSV